MMVKALDLDAIDELERESERIFERNMERRGFSFSCAGIFWAAFDGKGKLKNNWRLAMRQHQPDPTEHPTLYTEPRYYDASAATKQTSRHSREGGNPETRN